VTASTGDAAACSVAEGWKAEDHDGYGDGYDDKYGDGDVYGFGDGDDSGGWE
jgi:hypothetical protein